MLYVETKVTTTLGMYKKLNKTPNSDEYVNAINYNQNNGEVPTVSYNPKFSEEDIRLLREFLVNGEKYKWKQVTKEINSQALNRRYDANYDGSQPNSLSSDPENVSQGLQTGVKNVSPTFVMKQYQSMLGLPNHAIHFGTLGSSLPYVVAPNGWDDLPNVD